MFDNIIQSIAGRKHDKYSVLKKYYGYDSFYEGQESVIDNILEGKDVFAVMPTGAGKSICYQIPAIMLEGFSIVISPLISLMKDQVKALRQNGIRAAYINSSISSYERHTVMDDVRDGMIDVLYVAPERLDPSFAQYISSGRQHVSMVAVDEAHCISQWGHAFRPSYRRIPEFIASLSERPIVSAFTATATERVRKDIVENLQLLDPYVIVTSFDRPNLFFRVEAAKHKTLFTKNYIKDHQNVCGIIYCSTRKNVDELYEILNADGINVMKYHAGMTANERQENQERFSNSDDGIIIATNAFGMGIDKADVRFVLHYNMPGCIENYYQEAGRAGRDGDPAECVLLYSGSDIHIQRFMIMNSTDIEDLEDDIPYGTSNFERNIALYQENALNRLEIMKRYCETSKCLRHFILSYFGEDSLNECGKCSNCVGDFIEKDITEEAKEVINCMWETHQRYGETMIVQILAGSSNQKIKSWNLDKMKTYGRLSSMKQKEIKLIISVMLDQGYIQKTSGQYPVLKIAPDALKRLRNSDARIILKKKVESNKYKENSVIGNDVNQEYEINEKRNVLFELLRIARQSAAQRENVPPYVVSSDRSLKEMCEKLPTTVSQFADIYGMGKRKTEKYADLFLPVIIQFIVENGITENKLDSSSNRDQRYEDIYNDERENSQVDDKRSSIIYNNELNFPKHSKKNNSSKKIPFYLTEDQAVMYQFSEEPLTAAGLAKSMRSLNDDERFRKLYGTTIMKRLSNLGFLIERDGKESNSDFYQITEIGKAIGLQSEEKISQRGTPYQVIVFNKQAQEFVVKLFCREE